VSSEAEKLKVESRKLKLGQQDGRPKTEDRGPGRKAEIGKKKVRRLKKAKTERQKAVC
jgi:hypothetical protein